VVVGELGGGGGEAQLPVGLRRPAGQREVLEVSMPRVEQSETGAAHLVRVRARVRARIRARVRARARVRG
jgi:hypothetical protein